VNARDRIGKGPWQNSKGVVIARDVAELHGANNLTKQTALSEKGDVINGRGDTPNRHDALTGSQADGTAFAPGDDRIGLRDDDASKSWNSIPRADPMAAARKQISRVPAATACCIVSRRTEPNSSTRASAIRPSGQPNAVLRNPQQPDKAPARRDEIA
jgi:hypothetical protein